MKGKPAEWLDRGLMQGPFYRLCLSEADYVAQLDELLIPAHDRYAFMPNSKPAQATRYTSPTGQFVVIVCLDLERSLKQEPIVVAGMLVHEAVHIWQAHCDDIGERNPGDEQEAYAIQWLSQSLMWSFEEQTRKR